MRTVQRLRRALHAVGEAAGRVLPRPPPPPPRQRPLGCRVAGGGAFGGACDCGRACCVIPLVALRPLGSFCWKGFSPKRPGWRRPHVIPTFPRRWNFSEHGTGVGTWGWGGSRCPRFPSRMGSAGGLRPRSPWVRRHSRRWGPGQSPHCYRDSSWGRAPQGFAKSGGQRKVPRPCHVGKMAGMGAGGWEGTLPQAGQWAWEGRVTCPPL